MGRRALRKINPSIDLTGHLKLVEQLPRPWDAAAFSGARRRWRSRWARARGCSSATWPPTGRRWISWASKSPANTPDLPRLAWPRPACETPWWSHGDAIRLFHELLPDGSLAAVHVYFPDPWWKQRHQRRRVMRDSFVRDVERTLRAGGSLHFWTDVEEYFQATPELLAAETRLLGPLPVPETPAEHDMAYRTHFERRVRQSRRAGLSGGVQEGSGQDNITGVLAKDQRMIATYSSQKCACTFIFPCAGSSARAPQKIPPAR